MITGTAVGRLARAPRVVAPEGKSKFLALNLVCSKSFGGKTYENYVDVNVYGKAIDSLIDLQIGALLVATGEVSIRQSPDKKYTNLQIMGQVQVIHAPAAKTAAPPVTSAPRTAPAAKPDPDPEDDTVPF